MGYILYLHNSHITPKTILLQNTEQEKGTKCKANLTSIDWEQISLIYIFFNIDRLGTNLIYIYFFEFEIDQNNTT